MMANNERRVASDELRAEGFAFNAAEIESAVAAHKVSDGFELAVDEGCVIAGDGDAEDGYFFAVVVVDFGNGYIESALQSPDYAFDNAAFGLQRTDTL